MIDPGIPWYHKIWVFPFLLGIAVYNLVTVRLTRFKNYVKMKYILWRNPELKELQKLSGNDK